jgi:restriction system protein
MLPSGRQTRVSDRAGWSRTYLKQAGLLEHVGKGRTQITQRGKDLLATNPQTLTQIELRKYPEFVEFEKRRRAANKEADHGPDTQQTEVFELTPEDRIEQAAAELRLLLVEELVENLKQVTPAGFEGLVLKVLQSMGYGGSHANAAQVLGKSGDGGVDGVIQEDRLGLDEIYVQAKRYSEGAVGPNVVRAFAGSLDEKGTSKGVFITTSEFTKDARAFVERIKNKRISLIDGHRLAELMIDHGLGVVETANYTVHRLDTDFFAEF